MCLIQVEQARQLDRRQKEVLELALNYARRVVTHPIFSRRQDLLTLTKENIPKVKQCTTG